ncbi:TPA: type II toxin-antitoxin system VapC family toxin [Candidatus Woesearchaeota archaeon]|nr:hypothetical protein [archaeon]HIJ12081.1 type II toxin-antitoxin system VapC family toxin [Candidatus Woesearchaeota archaeon]|tara:strand:+ start:872 stop:1261 length:390 start_codon:yes stop_codon:yes gene_type:complete
MNTYVIDAYAWVEYFNGSPLGELVQEIVEDSTNIIYTNIVTVAELASSYSRNRLSFEGECKILKTLSRFHYIDENFAFEAGILHAKLRKDRKHIGLADTFVLLTARKHKAKVVTGDEDFRGLKEVIMIK